MQFHGAQRIMCDTGSTTRRSVLAMLAVAGAGTVSPTLFAAGSRAYRIDVHYHHSPPNWIKEDSVQRTLPPEVLQIAGSWTPVRALEVMDEYDILTSVCSLPAPVWYGDAAQSRRIARDANEYAAQMKRDYPKRFGSFASLPLPDIEGSLLEIEYAMDVLNADGFGLFTSYDDKWLADKSFAPVLSELNRRKAVVYVHPNVPVCCRKLVPGMSPTLVEFPTDTTRTIVSWVLTQSTTLYPDIRLIFSHSGGYLIGGLGRLQLLANTHPEYKLPSNMNEEIAKFYYEISSSADQVTMTALRSYVPVSHILLGTDAPYIGPFAPNIKQLLDIGLAKADLNAILRKNALALMPKLT